MSMWDLEVQLVFLLAVSFLYDIFLLRFILLTDIGSIFSHFFQCCNLIALTIYFFPYKIINLKKMLF